MAQKPDFDFIQNADQLEQCCHELGKHQFIAVDTEFLRERTYYPVLGLIQLASHNYTACIDPLALDDLEPLRKLLSNSNITKVVHAGEQDLEIFFKLWGSVPTPLFDTQIAATLTGCGESIGYAALVRKLLGVELDKTHTRTDWLQRPLNQKQLSYAAYDVIYLAQLYPIMLEQLEDNGRLEWLQDDFSVLANPEKYISRPENAWQKVKGIGKLRGNALMVANRLATWREQQAMEKDCTRKRILADDALLELARIQPDKSTDLQRFRHLQHPSVQKQLGNIISEIRDAQQVPKDQWPTMERKQPLSPEQEALQESLMTIIRLRASEENIAAGAIAGKKEVEKLVRGERNLGLLSGWRHQIAGNTILDFIAGRYCLQCSDNRLSLQPTSSKDKGA